MTGFFFFTLFDLESTNSFARARAHTCSRDVYPLQDTRLRNKVLHNIETPAISNIVLFFFAFQTLRVLALLPPSYGFVRTLRMRLPLSRRRRRRRRPIDVKTTTKSMTVNALKKRFFFFLLTFNSLLALFVFVSYREMPTTGEDQHRSWAAHMTDTHTHTHTGYSRRNNIL